ncbi:MAG: 16S rRNA (guanine(966)-N(2))-methyltransferase RsmD [Ignavibacteriae bacterium]|nr:16S rRNA (guanine(966)-N(2))-methyltransferase RsmD [Ignavibacteriota bacterium]
MRIISGKLKGRIITTSAPSGVRPTTDRARETIFNILGNMIDFDGIRVLDLCAGTGALGLEALSRGAAYCCFVELSRKTSEAITRTLRTFELEAASYNVITADSRLFAKRFSIEIDQQYDLIFTDPPYKEKIVNSIFNLIIENRILAPDGVFVAEHDIRETVLSPDQFEKTTSRTFGETVVDFFIEK